MGFADLFRRSYYSSSTDPDASAAERSAAADKRREEAESRRESERRWYARLPIIAIATLCVAVTFLTILLAVASQYTMPKVEGKPVTKEAEPKTQPAPPEKPPSAPTRAVSMNLKSKKLFGYNSSTLRVVAGSAQRELDECLQPHLTRVHIVGHADCIGSDEYNQGLSERRAIAVKLYLTMNGVDAALITTDGRGAALSKAESICTTVLRSTEATRAKLEPFRRVDVTCEYSRLGSILFI